MAGGRLIPQHGEAIVLRTWPFHEADLLVSFLTREQGVVKGVARHAMRSRRRFGGALEPGTHVTAQYTERPKEDLVRLDSFEILWSPLTAPIDYLRTAGLQFVVEVLEQALPERAPEDNVFRLALATLRAMSQGAGGREQGAGGRDQEPGVHEVERGDRRPGASIWLAVTYFSVWMNRLMGWWPELGHCAVCGLDLRGETVWWSPVTDGVTCHDDRRSNSRALSAASVAESFRIGRSSLPQMLEAGDWSQEHLADLREFATAVLERHLERRLRSAVVLR
jgi:DNA repair protein RecO (recombination protein O)